MAYNESRVTICGNLASRVTHTTVGTGQSKAKFRLFTAERRWDRETDTWIDGDTMFLSVVCWRKLADNVHASLNKGDPVVVTGRVTLKDLEDNGFAHQHVEVEATAVGPNLALCTATATRVRAAPEVVAPRKEDELPLVLPVEAEVPKQPPKEPREQVPKAGPRKATQEVPRKTPQEAPKTALKAAPGEAPKEVAEVPF